MNISWIEMQKHNKLYSYSPKREIKEGETKMEFEEINPNTWKAENEGDCIEGIYIAKHEDVGPNNSKTYYLEKEGNQTMIWGSTVIDSRMDFAKIGEYIKITYKGTAPNKKGQDTKIFKVERGKLSDS